MTEARVHVPVDSDFVRVLPGWRLARRAVLHGAPHLPGSGGFGLFRADRVPTLTLEALQLQKLQFGNVHIVRVREFTLA